MRARKVWFGPASETPKPWAMLDISNEAKLIKQAEDEVKFASERGHSHEDIARAVLASFGLVSLDK